MKRTDYKNGIPISPLLYFYNQKEDDKKQNLFLKKRLLQISVLSVIVAAAISIIAKLLIYLINLVTNIAFYGSADINFHSPATNHLGLWVILIPAIGGILVGIMALYGSKAIRGHGIPEAMEQILINKSKIKPIITFLKPISSAIAIGTGGPFGAEGPIIATGGALGSTLGQLFKITSNERKIILAAGATAGMSAIFGTPIAAIFLAVELLLFEFSPKAILPVALACITGAAGHHFLFESGPVFPMPHLAVPGNFGLGIYSTIGIIIGFLAVGLTKAVYYIEDLFEKLPIHWMWWPALGGLAVGLIGFYQPHTLGVGYDNIINILSGHITLALLLSLSLFKFLSWAIALGSGTSGGTLAPLLTIGGACGAIIGSVIIYLLPAADISLPMCALIGMSAMFAGASRAYLTSIAFALEATMQPEALLPLLGACTSAYLVSFFFMENTIMTEKIARRGVYTPDAYEPDILRKLSVAQVISTQSVLLNPETLISEFKVYLANNLQTDSHFIVVDQQGDFQGTVALTDLYNNKIGENAAISAILKKSDYAIKSNDSLSKAVELMSVQQEELIPVLSEDENKVIGVLTYKDILKAYKIQLIENKEAGANLSLKRQRMKMLIKGKRFYKVSKANS
ncbi:chloride channel protein [Pedobacter cryoconitis]|uniref:H+/Cl- antiporter ClcA n=1 Tax=Pedobacter cryoconitis TaxID=188932 RepID=A0A7X0J1G5_9SPHI|nr:chloride channel protein [Pedobacter cryoconitis]MBB6499364.1 H+/Cl- antiporter ClcA [Pedobacter cryoconitis]